MRKFFLLVVFSFLCDDLFAQTIAPAIQWQNTIGGDAWDYLYSAQQTTDGGYVLFGTSISNLSGDKTESCMGDYDFWIVKTDANGNILWQNTIGGNGYDEGLTAQQTTDGGFIIGGKSMSNISGDKTENSQGIWDYWVLKLSSTGSIEWQNTIGGNDNEYLQSIRQTNDGGYILGGNSKSNISGDKSENCIGMLDYWIVKLDSMGNIQWQNTIGGSGNDYMWNVIPTTDGGYALSGYSTSNISGDKTENCSGASDIWFVKLDAFGSIQWQNTIGGNADDDVEAMNQTSDGGYILGGVSNSNISGDKTENVIGTYGFADCWIIKLDSVGNIQWQNTIGGTLLDGANSISQTTDGGYIVGGNSKSNISGDKTENSIGNSNDLWILKLDALGNIQWQKTIGGNSNDGVFSASQTFDGGYILGGPSNSDISGDKTENSQGSYDYWLIKLEPVNCTPCPKPTNLSTTNISNHAAKTNWTTQSCALGYKVRLRKIGAMGWLIYYVNSNTGYKNISGLLPNTNYEWQVRSVCSYPNPLSQSAWTTSQTFTTPLRLEDESETQTDLILYPNPASNTITISSTELDGSYSMKIYNLLGQAVKHQEIDFNNATEIKLSVAELPVGCYELVLFNNKEFVTKRFVKE